MVLTLICRWGKRFRENQYAAGNLSKCRDKMYEPKACLCLCSCVHRSTPTTCWHNTKV